ncbi:glycosyltransferase, partial [Thermodesulfobacteriota bacterium]
MSKLLWVLEKQFDISLDTATYLETLSNLQARYDFRLLTGYRHRKIEPDIVRGKIQYYESVKIPVINRLTSYLYQIHTFSLAIKSFRPDVVIFTVSNPLLLRHAMLFKKKFGTKLISDVRSLPVSTGEMYRYISEKLFSLNLKYAARWFDGVTYITEEMRRFCASTYNLSPHSSAIWASGVNPDLFYPKSGMYNDGPLKFLYHGAINKKRGIDNLVRAVSLLNGIDLTLHLLGYGDALNELRNLAIELGLKDRVTFQNPIDYCEVPDWINRGHVGILPFPDWPGWNTSSPIKLFEYLSCGRPVVVTNIPAHRNVLHN